MQSSENRKTNKVLIVDDHPVVREALAIRISQQPDLEVCGEADDVTQALKLVESLAPDVAVIDISLKTGSGIDLIQRIKARNPSVRMLVWSMYDDSLYAERALYAGAMGYLNKENATGRIVDAIRDILAGKVYLSEDMSAQLLRNAVGGHQNLGRNATATLSNRELEVFQLIGNGFTTAQIASNLHLSVKTIETHRQRIKVKLNLTNTAELAREAAQ